MRFLDSNRIYRGRTGGRARPPLYRGQSGRASYYGHPPRGLNHLTTRSF